MCKMKHWKEEREGEGKNQIKEQEKWYYEGVHRVGNSLYYLNRPLSHRWVGSGVPTIWTRTLSTQIIGGAGSIIKANFPFI